MRDSALFIWQIATDFLFRIHEQNIKFVFINIPGVGDIAAV